MAIYENQTFSGTGYGLSIESRDRVVVVRKCRFLGCGLFVQARPGQRILVEDNVFEDTRFGRDDAGHSIIVSGLRGSDVTSCPVACVIRRNDLRLANAKLEDAINVISVQGTPARPIVVQRNKVRGRTVCGSGAETSICVDRGCRYVLVRYNDVSVESGNCGIVNVASDVTVTLNVVRGTGVNSGVASFDHYKDPGWGRNKVSLNWVRWDTPKGRNNYYVEKG